MLKNVFGRKDFMYAWFSGKKIFLLAEKTFILFLLVEFVLEHTHTTFLTSIQKGTVFMCLEKDTQLNRNGNTDLL